MTEANGDLSVEGLTKEFVSEADAWMSSRGPPSRCGGARHRRHGTVRIGEEHAVVHPGDSQRPTSGSVRLLGEDAFARSDAELARFRNKKIGFIFQDHHLLPQCDIVENVLIPALAGDGAGTAETRRANGLLNRVGLAIA